MSSPVIYPITDADRVWLRQFMIKHWGDEIMICRGEVFRPHEHLGFAAHLDGELAGLITYRIRDDQCEVLSLDSLRERQGIGTALMNAVIDAARRAGCHRIWLITTNDNLNALKFYQKRGFRLLAVYPGAVDESRKIKPSISLIGEHSIPLRDEIELEMRLD
jgi:GNAT superfamily N-acetyltransferase